MNSEAAGERLIHYNYLLFFAAPQVEYRVVVGPHYFIIICPLVILSASPQLKKEKKSIPLCQSYLEH